jgi:HSP90 family molecular chaperone
VSNSVLPHDSRETLEMKVQNMTFMIDRLHKDCSPLQYVRELTQNSIEAIAALPHKKGEIIWDVDWNRFALTPVHKLAVIDTGIGMTGEEMVKYINSLSASMHAQSVEGNFGVGAKIAAVPKNHE